MRDQQAKDLKRCAEIVSMEQAKRFIKQKTYRRINDRRGYLVCMKNLTYSGRLELKRLTEEVTRITNLAYPLPDLPVSQPEPTLPIPVDPHADAACLFSDRYRPTVEQARTAARHVAGCAECRAKLEEKGGE